MRKKALIFLILFALIAVYMLNLNITGFSTAVDVSVDEEVLNELSEEGKADVIVVLKEPKVSKVTGFITAVVQTKGPKKDVLATLSKNEFKKKHEYSIIKGFSGEVTAEGLEKLKRDPNVEKIYFDNVYSVSLTDSVPLINASKIHPYQIENQNITGVGETICILDTGVNYSHESLGGCSSLSEDCKVIAGYDYVNSDDDPYDDNGHGTHCAGIAAANGNVVGVAPDAKIVMIKVCNSGGSCSASNVLAGLEWCTNNKDAYNISAISMSFGDEGQHTTSDCPTDYADMPGLVAAYEAGILLVAASGNNHYTSGVSYPACNGNVTSIGAVDKSDGITYNRGGDVLTLLAPGVSITSTWYNGGTSTLQGTSMSTPHAAGAAAILQQYAKANAGVLSPTEINNALNNTGKTIYDSSSGGTYSRISVYEAIKSLTDIIGPSLTLASPSNLTYDTNTSLSLSYITNDLNDVDTAWYNLNGGENIILTDDTTFDTTEGSQILSLYANDSLGNENSITVYFITDVTDPIVTLTTQNDSYTANPTMLIFSLTEQNPDSCNLYGSWNEWHLNETKPASENSFTLNLEYGSYTWNVECNDTAGNKNFADENYTIHVDSTLPVVIIASPENTTYSTNIDLDLSFSAIDSNLDSCWYNVDEGSDVTIPDCSNMTFNVTEASHSLNLFANDSASNENYTEISFTTDLTNPVVNLQSPSDNIFSNSANTQFQFKASDENLASCNLYGSWNGWHLNQTKTEITSDALTSFDEIILEDGSYTWNVECIDTASHSTFNDTNYTITVDAAPPSLVIVLPENTTYSDNASLSLDFSVVDNNLNSCWYNLNDGTNVSITNCANTTFNTPNEQNNLKIYVKDEASNEVSEEVSFVADINYPTITLSSPSEGASIESSANFNYTVEDAGISNCSLLVNGTVNTTDDSITTSVLQEFSITLTDDNYYWSINCIDNANRGTTSEQRNVIICTENWNCTEWSTCTDSQQTRTCTDANSCGTTHSKSAESQSCTSDTGSSGSETGSESGPAGSSQISTGDEEEEEEIETPAAEPEQEQEGEQEETLEMEEITKEIIEEEKGFLSKTWDALKNIKEWVINPKQTITSVSTKAVDGVKGHKITAGSFVFIIAMMVFMQVYFLKKYKINIVSKVKTKIKNKVKGEMKIPIPPKIVVPQKVKDLKVKFKGIHTNIKEKIPPVVEPVKKAKESFFKKLSIFKSYRELLKPPKDKGGQNGKKTQISK